MSYGYDNKKNTGSQTENTNNTNKTNNNAQMKNASCNERQRRFVVFADEKINFYNVNAGNKKRSYRTKHGECGSVNIARVNVAKKEKFDFADRHRLLSLVVFAFLLFFFFSCFWGDGTDFWGG